MKRAEKINKNILKSFKEIRVPEAEFAKDNLENARGNVGKSLITDIKNTIDLRRNLYIQMMCIATIVSLQVSYKYFTYFIGWGLDFNTTIENDKILHFLLFLALSICFPALTSQCHLVVAAILTELFESIVDSEFESNDVKANLVGIIMGCVYNCLQYIKV